MAWKRGRVLLMKLPDNKLKGLADIRKKLSLDISITQLKEETKTLPYVIIDRITDYEYRKLIAQTGLADYLEFVAVETVDDGFAAWSAYKDKAEGIVKKTTEPRERNTDIIDYIAQMIICNPVDNTGGLELAEVLINNHYACELDWKVELDDFLFLVQKLVGVKKDQLPVQPEWFDDENDITVWCGILDKKWETKEMYMVGLDIESDSYVIFPYSSKKFETLKECATQVGYKIDLAKKL